MASQEVQVLNTSSPSLTAGRTRRKPRQAAASSPSARQQPTTSRVPLTIPVGRRGASQGTAGAGGMASAAVAAGLSTAQQAQQRRQAQPQQQQRAAADDDSAVIILDSDSDSDSDDDVIITGFKAAPPRKRPRLSPQQQQPTAAAAAAGPSQPAGQRVERGLHGGYFVMPTWGAQQQQQQQAAAAPPPRESSPEPVFKCLICLDGIKPENMGITPCGHMFCYTCIVEAVKATKKCPKCRKGVTFKGLKRIYPN